MTNHLPESEFPTPEQLQADTEKLEAFTTTELGRFVLRQAISVVSYQSEIRIIGDLSQYTQFPSHTPRLFPTVDDFSQHTPVDIENYNLFAGFNNLQALPPRPVPREYDEVYQGLQSAREKLRSTALLLANHPEIHPGNTTRALGNNEYKIDILLASGQLKLSRELPDRFDPLTAIVNPEDLL